MKSKLLEEIIDMGNSLGIPRNEMPQIDGEDMPEFLDYVQDDCGRDYEKSDIPAKELTPSQNELDTDKADKIWSEGNAHEHPIIVSGDKYVLDGHHRWLAVHRNDPDANMKCIVLSDNAEPALEMMHKFSKSKKLDIEDNLVEGLKLSQQILYMISEDSEADYADNVEERLFELGFEGIEVEDFVIDLEDKSQEIVFTDGESELLAVFWVDEELGPVVTVVEDESELEAEEYDVIQLLAPVVDGMIDFDNGVSWLSEDDIETILSWDDEEVSERSITVVRAGKKVRKQIIRKKRKKRLSAKRKLSIRRAVRKKKAKKAQIQRKRKRSLKVRKRAKLKTKPKNQKVVG